MNANEKENQARSDFEAQLAELVPTARLDRDRLMFQAGRVAARRQQRIWQLATATAVLVAVGLGIAQRRSNSLTAVERVVYVQQTVPVDEIAQPMTIAEPSPSGISYQSPESVSEYSYFRIRQAILDEGLSALPRTRPVRDTQSAAQLREQLLGNGSVNG